MMPGDSIQHNLSLNKAFLKTERTKDEPGKGCHWSIMPGLEHQFLNKKTKRRSSNSASVVETAIMGRPRTANKDKDHGKMQFNQAKRRPQAPPSRPRTQPPAEPTLRLPQSYTGQSTLPPLPTSQVMTSGPDLSLDGTIPISDAADNKHLRVVNEHLKRQLNGLLPGSNHVPQRNYQAEKPSDRSAFRWAHCDRCEKHHPTRPGQVCWNIFPAHIPRNLKNFEAVRRKVEAWLQSEQGKRMRRMTHPFMCNSRLDRG